MSTTLSPALAPASASADRLRPFALALAGSALVAVGAHFSLPLYFTPVPLTLAPLAVLLLGFAFGPRLAAATLVAYLGEGAMGLPVFAPGLASGFFFSGGLAHLFGPTGGYLFAYPVAAVVISLLWRASRRKYQSALAAAAAGSIVILCGGALWLAAITHLSAAMVLKLAILPFLPGEVLKIALAAAAAVSFERLRRKTS